MKLALVSKVGWNFINLLNLCGKSGGRIPGQYVGVVPWRGNVINDTNKLPAKVGT